MSLTIADAPVAPLKAGDVLAGKYRIERVLGAGGMGVVVAARHLDLDEMVAVKFLHQAPLGDGEAAARFLREARAAVKIRSEHVARVIDVGRFDHGAPYIVMEYLQVEDLAALVQSGPLEQEDAVDYVLQACDAMVEAHSIGIVHRDLKPANLFLTRRPDASALIKVLDFGISKFEPTGAPEAAITKTSAVIGSPYYMSPEQLRSAKEVDERTDVWSLGVILFELLAGQPPFQGESLPALLTAIVMAEPAPLRRLRPSVTPGLEAVVLRALQKDRDARYLSVGELAGALADFAPARSRALLEKISKVAGLRPSLLPAAARLSDPSVTPAAAIPGTMTAGTWANTGQGEDKPRRRGLWLLASLTAGGGLLALALAMSRWSSAPETPSPPSSAALPIAAQALATAPAAPAPPPVPDAPASVATEAADPVPPSIAPSSKPMLRQPQRAVRRSVVVGEGARSIPAVAAPEPVSTAAPVPSAGPKKRSLVIELK
ncbi:MAG: serine/threonine protein kinase [Myxococcales bacterium]|nr:MAG: serine/threonine protein kinase [Myxococcales bacterium]